MKVLFGLLLLVCVVYANRHILSHFNEFEAQTPEWIKGDRATPTDKISFRFYLKQRNMDKLEALFWQISDPDSPKYGKYMTKEEINEMIAPPQKIRNKIMHWLKKNGVAKIVDNYDAIKCDTTVEIAEKVFNTELYSFVHIKTNKRVNRHSQHPISIPKRFASEIEFAVGLGAFPIPPQKAHVNPAPLENQNGKVVPYVINRLYNIQEGIVTNDNSSLCLAEFQDDKSFRPTDLAAFQKENALPDVPVYKIVGPFSSNTPDTESTLDVEYGSGVAVNASVWFWTAKGWMLEFANDFFNTADVPFVVSMSWGWPEDRQCQIANCNGLTSVQYVTRVNNEWIKIGNRGVTLLAASGDQGAPGDGNPYCADQNEPLSTIFPGASPYVTSVGATMLVSPTSNEKVAKPETAANPPPVCSQYDCAPSTWVEQACSHPNALITTGGGFSDYSPRPSYQSAVVSQFLANNKASLPPAQYFNSSNRGFPDISALGHNYLINWAGFNELVDGTSCSTPVVGGMVAIWNDYQFNNNRPALGFINPLLYKMYSASPSKYYQDIVTGSNECTEAACCKYGYKSTSGWDPVTGLGTPHFENMFSYIKQNGPQ